MAGKFGRGVSSRRLAEAGAAPIPSEVTDRPKNSGDPAKRIAGAAAAAAAGGRMFRPPGDSDDSKLRDVSFGGGEAVSRGRRGVDDDGGDGDDEKRGLDAETIAILGPVENTSQLKKGGRSLLPPGQEGFNPTGPRPLWMEKQGMAIGEGAHSLPAAAVAPSQQRHQASAGPPPEPGAVRTGGVVLTQGMETDVTIINHTDVNLKMIAVDQSGRRAEKLLRSRDATSFDAPAGCTLSILNPASGRSLLRYVVTNANTTLAVTEAALLRDGEVGSSGKWYDNRTYCILAGAGGVLVIVAAAVLAYMLFQYFLAKRLATR